MLTDAHTGSRNAAGAPGCSRSRSADPARAAAHSDIVGYDRRATTNPDGSPIFIKPTTGTFNNARVRGIIRQPGFQNWNMGLFKTFALTEKRGLQFRAEAYNVWNHPNWCGNSGCSGTTNIGIDPTNTTTFGKVLTKGSGSSGQGERNLQLSLRFYF